MRRIGTLHILTLALAGLLAALLPIASGVARADTHSAQAAITLYPSDAQGNAIDGPGYFEATANPGDVVTLSATLGNEGAGNASVTTTPVDAQTSLKGGIAFSLAGQTLHSVGTWLRLPSSHYTVAAGKGVIISFSVHVPRTAGPGQYIGGVSAFARASKRSPGHIGIRVQTRIVNAVVITVPGPDVQRLSLARVSVQRQTHGTAVLLQLLNAGNTLLQATGHLWVWRQGTPGAIMSTPITIGTTVPHDPVLYPVMLGANPPAAGYTYKLQLHWAGGGLTRHGAFTITR